MLDFLSFLISLFFFQIDELTKVSFIRLFDNN